MSTLFARVSALSLIKKQFNKSVYNSLLGDVGGHGKFCIGTCTVWRDYATVVWTVDNDPIIDDRSIQIEPTQQTQLQHHQEQQQHQEQKLVGNVDKKGRRRKVRPSSLLEWKKNYDELESYVAQWRHEEEGRIGQASSSSSSKKSASSDLSLSNNIQATRYLPSTPEPTNEKLKSFLVRERISIRRDAMLYGYDAVSEKVKLFDQLGFSILPHLDRWNRRYFQLVDYLKNHDWKFPQDCEWNINDEVELSLYYWCRKQRYLYRYYNHTVKGKESTTRNAAYYITTPSVEELTAAEQNVNNLITSSNEENLKLYLNNYGWRVFDTVNKTVNVPLTEERIQKLNRIGFVWNCNDKLWDEMFLRLIEYKEMHGNCLVSYDYQKDPQLGKWVYKQQFEYQLFKSGKFSHMLQPRIDRLNSINFAWRVTDAIDGSFTKQNQGTNIKNETRTDQDFTSSGNTVGTSTENH